jgi:2-hydroxy-3-oxopropionate reductase
MNVGFIGAGAMGTPMALRTLRHGHDVGVFARRPGAAQSLVDAGAASYPSPASLAGAVEVIVTIVTGTSDVEEVLFGPNGAAEGAHPGTVVIDMSTISPAATRRIAAALGSRHLEMLDAPVSGGPGGAGSGTLTIMVGGDAEVLDRVRPLLDCLGTKIVHVGGHGAGQTVKACNQLALLVTAEGAAEALALAHRAGLDIRRVREALLGGFAASRVLELFGGRMVERQFQAGIPARLYDKDLRIVLDTAGELGQELPAASVVMAQIEELMSTGRGDHDLSVLFELLNGSGAAFHK